MGQPLERIAEQYEIIAKIKEGGMGEIYKVRHRLLDELRVVKVLRPQLAGDDSSSVRFAREARSAIRLRHPNVVQIFDFTLDDAGVGLMVMEYIQGADLKQLITGGLRPAIPLALEIARQGLQALGYLHRQGFVHRDVSPDNLMLTRDVENRPLVKLIDLGIAKRLDSDHELTATGMFLGKYRYASPEHFGAGDAVGIDARSDLYTFALVLYELVTGRFPLPGETTTHFVASHLYREPLDFAETDPRGRIPEALRRALLKSLAKEPDRRFADAAELVATIEAIQRRHPLDEDSFAQAAELIAVAAGESNWGPPGSTGGRLNREFAEAAVEPPAAEKPPTEQPVGGESPVEKQQDQEPAIAEVAREVADLLDRGALLEADRLLFQATESYGADGVLAEVRERRDELYRGELAAQVRALLVEAEQLAGTGAIGPALETVRKAQAMEPEDPELARELAERAHEVRAQIGSAERRDQESRVLKRVGELVRDAGIAFESERFREAADLLRQALEATPEDPWLRDRLAAAEAGRRRLEEEQRRRRRARSLLSQAEEAESFRDVLKARLLVTKALELAPEDLEAQALAKVLDRRSIEPALTPEVAAAVAEIRDLRRRGESLAAWRRIQAAIEELGDDEALGALRREIADELVAGEEPAVDDR